MTATIDSPALRRLDELERRPRVRAPRPSTPSMGYQAGLDGLRAISVIAVIFYHAGFGWMHGGFFGVEVFFVVSGFLITSLLIEERERTGAIALRQFWYRRARRLLPALGAVLVTIATWAAVFGSDEQVSQMRHDLPWSIFYVANWGQILGDVPYFAAGDPPLLRHLWSLAVEEQWYLIWPFAFVLLARKRLTPTQSAGWLAGVAVAIMAFTFWLHSGDSALLGGPVFEGSDRTNFMYLSTVTRSTGLLLGAAAAFVWRPWRTPARRVDGRQLDVACGVAIGMLVCIFGVAVLTEGYVYQWLLPLVSVLSLAVVLTVVHPAAHGARAVFSTAALVEVGRRSYGIYLWHWPIFVIVGATDGSAARFLLGLVITAIASELCFQYVETPIREGALGFWWARREPTRWSRVALAGALGLGLLAFYSNVEQFDAAAGGDDVEFVLSTDEPADEPVDAGQAGQSAQPIGTAAVEPAVEPAVASTAPLLPRHVAIVGDSQAHSLAINLPDGIGDTFVITDGSVDGCGVHDSGRVLSSRDGFTNSFSICEGWQQQWASAASQADVALVVIGAWDVFDVEIDGTDYVFGSPEFDQLFTDHLRSGIDAMVGSGAKVALLEVACMRPQDVDGAGVPALPERGDDTRVAHLNELLRGIAGADPANVTFVAGPAAWCGDEAIATDLGHRWDGVHVYKPGAKLIYETIAPALLAIPT
ncbi:MAG: acyltransferase family protein [Ilumatobacteraceae bacterium]